MKKIDVRYQLLSLLFLVSTLPIYAQQKPIVMQEEVLEFETPQNLQMQSDMMVVEEIPDKEAPDIVVPPTQPVQQPTRQARQKTRPTTNQQHAHHDAMNNGTLTPGRMYLRFAAGFSPSIYTRRCNNLSLTPINDVHILQDSGRQVPKFSDQFKLPTIAFSVEFSKPFSPYNEIGFEIFYNRAKGQCYCFTQNDITFREKFDDYSAFAFYLSNHLYSERMKIFAVFVGTKVGIIHRNRINFELFQNCERVGCKGNQAYFKPSTSISGGLNLGLDIKLTGDLSLVINAEFVASCELRNNHLIPITQGANTATSIIGETGTVLTFPVTFGLKKRF